MKMPDNKIESVIQYFHLKLECVYPKTEIDSFFWILLESETGFTRLDFMKNPDLRLSESQLLTFISFSRRLVTSEPVQYIAGETDFMGRIFKVAPSVLIPRPETEELVSWITKNHKSQTNLDVIDIGTGSGCIAISLKAMLSNATVMGIDIQEDALEIAKENAVLNNVDVDFQKADALNLSVENEKYDVVVSNPPYVLDSEKLEMQNNVLDYEPHMALFVDDDKPLLFYKAIAEWATKSLKSQGFLYFEINEKYAALTISMLEKLGFVNCESRTDIFDKERMVIAQKR